jgi:hypothetical protein
MQMLELEMIDEVFLLMQQFEHIKDVQRAGLAIVELLIMDDPEWRDEVARKGGVRLLCSLAENHRDSTNLMCQIMTCMSYMAAEDYIEIMLGQHDALQHVTHALRHHVKNIELVTRTTLALLNLTTCEAHVEEVLDKGVAQAIVNVMGVHKNDVHLTMIVCGALANLSIVDDARAQLAKAGLFPCIQTAMKLDPDNAMLQIACLKAVVNYTIEPNHYLKMQEFEIPDLVGAAMAKHGGNTNVQTYGNYFFGQGSSCAVM